MSFNFERRLERQAVRDRGGKPAKSRKTWGHASRGPGITKKLSNQPRKAKR